MKFEEYRGIKNLVVAELTETVNEKGETVATYGDVIRLAGVQAVSGEVS